MATSNLKLICSKLSRMRLENVQIRTYIPPRYRPPYWFMPKERVLTEEHLTRDNKHFIEEMMHNKLKTQEALESPLTENKVISPAQWAPNTRRVGLIARKIGNYPLWTKDGKKKQTTLLQVVDNHVIKYIPPEEFTPMKMRDTTWKEKQKYGCLLVGAETMDPSKVTKEYSGLFNSVGMLPKRHLCRFIVSRNAVLPTGTPLYATHFRVGDHIDVRGLTIDRGFQGVIKRWGFKGMPASHGVTKTHRRPGNIGAGGQKARVWPGTKMPGHMGNRWRINRGVKILRINTKYNVIWTLGVSIPGETGSLCYLYDSILPLKKHNHKSFPPFPTYSPAESDDPSLEYFDESIHQFENPSIAFEES